MRIALFHDAGGGAKRALYEHARGLKEKGHRIDLFSFSVTEEGHWDVRPFVNSSMRVDVRFVRLRQKKAWWWPPLLAFGIEWANYLQISRACARIAETINRADYDVVYAHPCRLTHTPPLLWYLKEPSVYFCQEPIRRFFEPEESRSPGASPGGRRGSLRRSVGSALLARLEKRSLSAASRLLVNSAYSREYLLHVYRLQAAVCYLGVDAGRFRPLSSSRENLVLSVGALNPLKGHDFVITAVAQIPRPDRPRVVVIADRAQGGEAERLRSLAHIVSVDLEIFAGISDHELVEWYNRARALACGQVLEPFGLVVLEALACETPVVAVREGGLRETVIDGQTGYLTHRDPAAFAERLHLLLKDDGLRARLGKTGREWVLERWTWERSVSELEVHLHELAKSR